MRYDIRDGDTTTAGGTVFATHRGDMLDGREIAYEGDPVRCPACGVLGLRPYRAAATRDRSGWKAQRIKR
jgi:uncharacterized Zn-binding protein involved in type VI secretion